MSATQFVTFSRLFVRLEDLRMWSPSMRQVYGLSTHLMSHTRRAARTHSLRETFFVRPKILSRFDVFLTDLLNRHNTYVADTPRGEKDTAVTGLVANGTVLPLWISTRQKISADFPSRFEVPVYVRVLPDTKAQSIEMLLKYLDDMYLAGYLDEAELVLLDRGPGSKKGEKQELSEELDDWFKTRHIKYMLYPVGAGSIESPNDVHFHSQFKMKLHQLLDERRTTSEEVKLECAVHAYYSIPEATICRYFKSCGITGGSPKRLAHSLCLGRDFAVDARSPATKGRLRECLDAYDAWNRKFKFSGRAGEPEPEVNQLAGTALDGDYWRKWGWQSAASAADQ
jgi:hypothetical protein